jgi:PAS domain-containing protein
LIRHRESTGNIVYDDHNRAVKLVGITRDVTNEVQTYEMIQREARIKDDLSGRLNAAIETAGLHCWQLSFPGPELVWSQNAVAELGAQVSELPLPELLQELMHGIHPDDVAEFTTHTDAALQQGVKTRTFRYRRIMADGSLQYFRAYHHYHCHNDQMRPYVLGACINITQQVQTSEQLRRQKEELEQLHMRIERAALSSQEGHWEVDVQSGPMVSAIMCSAGLRSRF